jgi:D-lyxose ketol-isomerase
MKRSKINTVMRAAGEFIRERGFFLPPFADWTLADWEKMGPSAKEIVENRLGWDITDFGQGKFDQTGLFLFTIRNGNPYNLKTGKTYCEKILIVQPGQTTPMHFHWRKMEDIINRGGGNLLVRLYNSDDSGELDRNRQVVVSMDGIVHTVEPGRIVELRPGESITLTPGIYHEFWSPESRLLIGEVSLVNDDVHDNRFLKPVGRFPAVEEDEDPVHLLCSDYEKFVPNLRAVQGGPAYG